MLAILLAFGLAFLSRSSAQYEGALASARAVEARQLARASLERVQARLNKDLEYPPRGAVDQESFSYVDRYSNGTVRVTLDLRYLEPPYEVLVVRCQALVGRPETPLARRSLEAEFDLAEFERGTTSPNPARFRLIRLRDPAT